MASMTLELDDRVAATARRLAEQRHTTVAELVSAMIEDQARMAAEEDAGPEAKQAFVTAEEEQRFLNDLALDVRDMVGLAKLPPGETADDLRWKAMCEKHGLAPRGQARKSS